MINNFYEILWIFIIYAFLGWCTEVSYAALQHGKFVNRGFLIGPYCPIYGMGILIVVVILSPLKENLLVLYIGSFLLTSVLEFVTGYALEIIFHNKWWDYSLEHYNIHGYICLKFSLIWGFACTFVMLIIHPIIEGIISLIPYILGIFIISILMTVFIIDCTVTVSTIMKLNRRMKALTDIIDKLKEVSNQIGENIFENVMEAIEKKDDISDEVSNLKTKVKIEQEELILKYKELYEKKSIGSNRLMKAFPSMKSKINNDILQKLKEKL